MDGRPRIDASWDRAQLQEVNIKLLRNALEATSGIDDLRGRLWAAPNDGPGVTLALSIPREPEESVDTHGPGAFASPRVMPEVYAMGTP